MSATGFAGLEQQLTPEKARLCLRLVAAGRRPEPADFDKQGVTLSADEVARIDDWLQRGLRTHVVEEVEAGDGTVRLGIGLDDERRVEAVAMPVGAVCVSTQVGCAVGCRFCASGLFGVERNLEPGEIVEQVVHARRAMHARSGPRLERVVYMGMGEPSHNLEAVLAAAAAIKQHALIGPKRQTLSTVGSLRCIERMAQAEVRPCLALSLHLACDARRRELLPRAHKDSVRELVPAASEYGRSIGMPIQLEWTLLDGVNDSDADIDQLIELAQGVRGGLHGYVNFIVWNPVADLPFAAPPRERTVAIVRKVKQAGILATIRDSAGPDAEAACGQLRLRQKTGGS